MKKKITKILALSLSATLLSIGVSNTQIQSKQDKQPVYKTYTETATLERFTCDYHFQNGKEVSRSGFLLTLESRIEFEMQDAVEWDKFSDGGIVNVTISDAGTPDLLVDDFVMDIGCKWAYESVLD